MSHYNTCISIYEMGDTSTFVRKGDTPAFVMGDRIRDASAFVIKGGAPLEMCVSFTCRIGDAQ
jgi:hypothetical protein